MNSFGDLLLAIARAELQNNPGEASSSSTSQGSGYEVFLSFRGEDTSKGFTDHLYNKLVDAGIRTFRDNKGIPTGEKVRTVLLNIDIENSKICIPILSRDYASSKWCLIELTQMMKCKRDMGQIILPIFYDVSPRIVKDQLGSFGDAFRQHDTDRNVNKVEVRKWKEALKEVGNMKGKIYDGREAKLVDEIVAEVLIKLNKASVEISDKLVGMSHHAEEMRRILDIDSEGVRIVGIHGMGGIGKTTIVNFMYEQLAQHYQHSSFIEDIREEATTHKDPVHLQNRLIRDILKVKDFDVRSTSEGKKRIKDELRNKKVLIVLDDVDNQSQLEAVAGDVSWFGSGSRIIVTTRDKAVLNRHTVTWIYEPEGMSRDHSLQLFSLHAFNEINPPADFYELSQDIVRTGAGLPLFMVVIGSLLKGHLGNKPFWESTSKKLISIPDEDVLDKLKMSYDTLDNQQKAIFLDIADNLIGGNRRYCVYMWDDFEFFGENGVGVLVSRALVKIEGNRFRMHDVVRDLGRYIVRQEKEKPISRLWRCEDAEETLIDCKGTENVQTLTLMESLDPKEAFTRFSNLECLKMTDATLRDGFMASLPKLRWLSLKSTRIYPCYTHLCLKKLVVLQLIGLDSLDGDELQKLMKVSTKLKVLHIEDFKKLTKTPDFSSFPDLEIINLVNCKELVEISPSIKHLNRLTSFTIYECLRVLELPKDLGPMDALKELIFVRSGVTEILVPKGSMKNLRKLSAEGCRSLTQISSIVHLRSLQHLNFEYGGRISEIPESIGRLVKLRSLSFDYGKFIRLPSSFGSLVNLQYLSFGSCVSLVELPDSLGNLANLQYLSVSGCKSLVKLPSSIGSLVKLRQLSLEYCESLVELPDSICSLVELKYLLITGSYSLVKLPDSIGSLVNLRILDLERCNLSTEIPDMSREYRELKKLADTISLDEEKGMFDFWSRIVPVTCFDILRSLFQFCTKR